MGIYEYARRLAGEFIPSMYNTSNHGLSRIISTKTKPPPSVLVVMRRMDKIK